LWTSAETEADPCERFICRSRGIFRAIYYSTAHYSSRISTLIVTWASSTDYYHGRRIRAETQTGL
jgi:hypothetical protein